MAATPSPAPMPRTLGEAKTVIANLRKQLAGHGSPAGGKEPIAPAPQDPHPILPGRNPPINPKASLDLAGMSPKRFAETLELCDDKALLAFLSRETGKSAKTQDARVIRRLYEEIKKRRT
jgi:hypothetical protein